VNNNVNDFLKSKNIQYKTIDCSECLKENNDYLYNQQSLPITTESRTNIVALNNDIIVGYITLFHQQLSCRMPIEDALTISNIMIKEKYRNNKIGTTLIDLALNYTKNNNKILMRTEASLLGRLYTLDKISLMAEQKELPFIHHNLSFIYFELSKSLFKDINISQDNKVALVNQIAKDMISHPKLEEWGIDEVRDINYTFSDVMNDTINVNRKSYSDFISSVCLIKSTDRKISNKF